jgi:hypothetical protein
VAEHLVPDDHQEMVLRQIESEPLSETLADAERVLQPRRLVEARWRQPPILDVGERALHRQQVGGAGRRCHVAIDEHHVRPTILSGCAAR